MDSAIVFWKYGYPLDLEASLSPLHYRSYLEQMDKAEEFKNRRTKTMAPETTKTNTCSVVSFNSKLMILQSCSEIRVDA